MIHCSSNSCRDLNFFPSVKSKQLQFVLQFVFQLADLMILTSSVLKIRSCAGPQCSDIRSDVMDLPCVLLGNVTGCGSGIRCQHDAFGAEDADDGGSGFDEMSVVLQRLLQRGSVPVNVGEVEAWLLQLG